MSGIAVIWNLDGRPVETAQLVQMTQLMEHRGPDGERHWFHGAIGLGHRALNTTPESSWERLPLADEAAGLCLTFDGRIDNREDLKALLADEISSSNERPVTDAELVLAAYRKWGEECPEHLLGDFAFAIWDERRKRLFCARDHQGMRPFFYARVGNTFVCASEIRALFAVPALKKEPNLATVTVRLLGRSVEFDDTLYKGVSRLPMAHCLTVSRDTIHQRRYWDIDPEREIRYRSDEEYGEHFRELFFEAVRCRLRSQVPIASMLSGGLDSSSIVCTAQRIRQQQQITEPAFESFSMIFEHFSECDERPYIEEVIRSSGVKANFHVGDRDLSEAAIARHTLYPGLLYSPQWMVLGSMFGGMKDRKFRVLLDGNGGDQLAGNGFHHLLPLARSGRWLRLIKEIPEYAFTYGVSPWFLFLNYCLKPSVPDRIKTVYHSLQRSRRANPNLNLVREDALDSTGARERLALPTPMPAFRSLIKSEMYAMIFSGWGPAVLMEAYELLTSYCGIELRQPFRDRRLLEFAMALPPNQLWRHGWSRIAFRNAMKPVLPEKIVERRGKALFSEQYESVLAGSQADEVRSLLDDSILARLGLANAAALRNIVERYQVAPRRHSSLQLADLVALDMACREILGEPIFHVEATAGILGKNDAKSSNARI